VKNGRAQICNFGLLEDNASFLTDTVDCQDLFGHASDPYSQLPLAQSNDGQLQLYESVFQEYIVDVMEHGLAVEDGRQFYNEVRSEVAPKYFPFDLFFHLVHCPELWRSGDDSLDVGGALAELTRGLDEGRKASFKAELNGHIATRGFISPGYFQ
jgi:hypothetical protein